MVQPVPERDHEREREPLDDVTKSHILGIAPGDRLVVGVLAVAAIVLLAAHWAQLSGWGTRPVDVERIPRSPVGFQLDLNEANWIELSQLEGIGPRLARRIVDDRSRRGRFSRIEDLQRVHGIGPRTVKRIGPWLRVEPVRESRER